MKSLKAIQTISKVLWVICKVMFILCIVGAAGCLLSLVILPITKDVVVYEDVSLTVLLADKGTSVTAAIVACAIGLFVCGVGIALAKYSELFFKKELDKGTPFDKEIVKNMRVLALVHIAVSVGLGVILGIAVLIIRKTVADFGDVDISNGSSFWFGISLLIISLFCEYGAENSNNPPKVE